MPGSLTKEPPLATLDATIQAITPGMPYSELLRIARSDPAMHKDAPGLLRNRFLLLNERAEIVYDRFLSLVNAEGVTSARVRKVMYFLWMFRDERVRGFITQEVATPEGHWRVDQLTDKRRASFFRSVGLGEKSAVKARSNIEFFLRETGIVTDHQVHLELDDGWFEEAVQVAAQHEPEPTRRRAIINAPVDFIISQGWQGLLNATVDELRGLSVDLADDTDPLADGAITPVTDPRRSRNQDWNRSAPVRGSRATTTVNVDLVAKERASSAHHLLERITAEAASAHGHEPQTNENIDVFFVTPAHTVICEMKSCQANNFHAQVRRGVAQLLEYRYIYSDVAGDDPCLALIVETPPPPAKHWLDGYLQQIGIKLVWKAPAAEGLVAFRPIPSGLTGVVSEQPS